MLRSLLSLAVPVLFLCSAVSVLRRKRRGEDVGSLGFEPVSPGGNPLFAPGMFRQAKPKVEQVDEAWRGGAAPPDPGILPGRRDTGAGTAHPTDIFPA